MIGKLPPRLLKELVLENAPSNDPSVIIGPRVGEDAAVIDVGGDSVLVTHSDTISAAKELIGWLSIHVVANDVAVTGARPKWFLLSLMMPSHTDQGVIKTVMNEASKAVKELTGSLVGGHTEFTTAVKRAVTVSTAFGLTSKGKYVSTSGAKPGDIVIMTKYVGLEGTAILATDFGELLLKKGVKMESLELGKSFIKEVSVVPEALLLAEGGYANSMHDPTEGGVLGGLTEMAYASGTTIRVDADKVPIHEVTMEFCKALGIDPLKLISSGVLIASLPKPVADRALNKLEERGIKASIIGEVVENKGHLLELNTKEGRELFDEVVYKDELIMLANELSRSTD